MKGKEGTKGKRAHVYLTESAGDESWGGGGGAETRVRNPGFRGMKKLRKESRSHSITGVCK